LLNGFGKKLTSSTLQSEEILFLYKAYFMHELIIANGLYFHKNPIYICSALVLANGERLSPFRRSLVDNIKFIWSMLLKKVSENKFSLSFTVGLNIALQGNINSLIKVL
jgi:hypothetical protein